MPGDVTLATADHLAPASGSSTPAPGAEPSAPEPAGARWERLAARIIAAAIALFGFLPLMNWVPGGYGDPLFGLMLTEWITGSSIVLGLGGHIKCHGRREAVPECLNRTGKRKSAGRLFVQIRVIPDDFDQFRIVFRPCSSPALAP